MAAYITVGSKTTHGGTVISGSPHTTHNGIPVARKGDKVSCKKCKRVVAIATGDPSFIIDGSPIARAGDVTSCGSKLVAIQQAFAQSDFEVGSIAQAAPLIFPKTEKDDILTGEFLNEEENIEHHFSISVIEFNDEGNYIGRFDLEDNPSGLIADSSEWQNQKGLKKVDVLYEDIISGLKDTFDNTLNGINTTVGNMIESAKGGIKNVQNRMIINLGVLESGLKNFPSRTKASAATAMLQFGQRVNVDFVYISVGGGVKHFSLETSMAVNVHNGNVYVPVTANANVNTNKSPSVDSQIGVGRILSSNIKNDTEATDNILSGQGHSYSVEIGPASSSIDTTHDGLTVAGSATFGKKWELKNNTKGNNSVGGSKGSTNMQLASYMKYDRSKNIIRYIGN